MNTQVPIINDWADLKSVASFPLVARHCPETLSVVFGCRTCIKALKSGHISMPCRYKSSEKSHSFAHFNVGLTDIKRAVSEHPVSKMHSKASGIHGLMSLRSYSSQLETNAASVIHPSSQTRQGVVDGIAGADLPSDL